MIDAHGHLSDTRLNPLALSLTQELITGGVKHMILGGINPEEWESQINLDKKFPGFFSKTFGMHPWTVISHTQSDLESMFEKLKDFVSSSSAIGEIGLDFAKESKSNDSIQKQMYWLEQQLDLANALEKPIILHVVKGHDLVISALKNYPKLKGIVHGWNSNSTVAKNYLDKGFLLGIGPRYIQPKDFEALKWLPKTTFCIESDGPDFVNRAPSNTTAVDWIHHLQSVSTFLSHTFEISPEDVWKLNQSNLSKLLTI